MQYIDINNIKINKLRDNYEGYSYDVYNNNYNVLNVSSESLHYNQDILKEIKEDIFSSKKYNSIFELSSRSSEFLNYIDNINKNIKYFLKIPNKFKIIWIQGGENDHYSSIPLNMSNIFDNVTGYYIVNGKLSRNAYNESKKFINSKILTEDEFVSKIDKIREDADYLYICSNEMFNGTELNINKIKVEFLRELDKKLIIVDMCIDLFMKEINWNLVDIVTSSTRNIGINGCNIMIIRENLLNKLNNKNKIPYLLDWKNYIDQEYYNKPSHFYFYLVDKLIKNYIDDMKNILQMDNINQAKAQYLYEYLKYSKNFKSYVNDSKKRSNINILFIVKDGNIKTRNKLLDYCFRHNIVGLRIKDDDLCDNKLILLQISLYNYITIDDVLYIVKVMKNFDKLYK